MAQLLDDIYDTMIRRGEADKLVRNPSKKSRLPSEELLQGFKRRGKLFSLGEHLEILCTAKGAFLLVVYVGKGFF